MLRNTSATDGYLSSFRVYQSLPNRNYAQEIARGTLRNCPGRGADTPGHA